VTLIQSMVFVKRDRKGREERLGFQLGGRHKPMQIRWGLGGCASDMRAGRKRPHPRRWLALAGLVDILNFKE